jgi:hypothetical protein
VDGADIPPLSGESADLFTPSVGSAGPLEAPQLFQNQTIRSMAANTWLYLNRAEHFDDATHLAVALVTIDPEFLALLALAAEELYRD